MSSKLLINVNDASSGVVVPDTGVFSALHDDGANFNASMVLPIIGISILIIAIVTGVIIAISRRKKVNRFTTHTNKHILAKLATLSVVMLLGLLAMMYANQTPSLASAVLLRDGINTDTLTITASDIKINIDLDNTAAYGMGEGTVSVNTATKVGYTLMAYVDSANTGLTNKTDKSSNSVIAMLDSTEPSALAENTWGVAATRPTNQASAVFTGLPTSASEAQTLRATHRTSEVGDTSTFYYGAYVTPDIDYGAYSGATITYIAVANMCNPYATSIDEAECLQDFAGQNTDRIIDSMTPNAQYTLMDKRDEKFYTIAKLLGNAVPNVEAANTFTLLENQTEDHYTVWMTQNLDLDIDSDTTYTNEDTDLGYNTLTGQYETASWKPERSTYTEAGIWGVDSEYYVSAEYINIHPESYDPGDTYWNSLLSNGNDWWAYWRECRNGFDPEWSEDDYCIAGNPAFNYLSNTGSSHYHLGNFYNWTAAVATNDSSDYIYADDWTLVEQSICPAGWTLPRIGYGEDSFAAVWYEYVDGDFENNISALWSEPLYLPTSGYYNGKIGSTGIYGGFWSSVSYGHGTGAVGFGGFDVNGYVFAPGFFSIDGLTVRCVARPVTSMIVED